MVSINKLIIVFILTTVILSIVIAPIKVHAANITGSGSGGVSRPKTTNTIYISKYDIEKYGGKSLTTGNSIYDYGITTLISCIANKMKYGWVGAAVGIPQVLVDQAVRKRTDILNRIRNDIIKKGAKGMKITTVGKAYGYPTLSLKFDTWW